MDRMTMRGDHGVFMGEKWDFGIDPDDYNLVQKILDRLASYEDTGLEPDEIVKIGMSFEDSKRYSGRLELKLKAYEAIGNIGHIRGLLQAEQAGKLVMLPCKVGSRVWVDGREAIVSDFFGYETERYLHAQFYDNMQYIDIPFGEVGKTVFLTREEAEAALSSSSAGGGG